MSEIIEEIDDCYLVIQGRNRGENSDSWGYISMYLTNDVDGALRAMLDMRRRHKGAREYRLIKETIKRLTEVLDDGDAVTVNG